MTEKYTKYEVARMLGSRALQLASGAPFLVKLSEKDLEAIQYSTLEIAKREFAAGVLPITIRRPLPRRTRNRLASTPTPAPVKVE